METLVLTPEIMQSWTLPAFQAPLKVNAKVREVADDLQAQSGTPCINGVISLGRIRSELMSGAAKMYLVDGQHRREAFLMSGLKEVYADVRINVYETMEEMAQDYLRLNSPISRKTPDDQLRALQESSPALKLIAKECPYIGYRYIRANPDAPLVGMAAVLRRWRGAGYETPAITGAAGGAATLATELRMEDAEQIVRFMQVAFAAWGKDIEYKVLWSALNMTMCMWLWRVLVLDRDRTGSRRYVVLTVDQFRHCLMAVSADAEYIAWLAGRLMAERDRAPCYRRIRAAFIHRLHDEMSGKIKMPSPPWMNN
jgi:hypothetical protein